jgi:hypothetical protein
MEPHGPEPVARACKGAIQTIAWRCVQLICIADWFKLAVEENRRRFQTRRHTRNRGEMYGLAAVNAAVRYPASRNAEASVGSPRGHAKMSLPEASGGREARVAGKE